MSSFSSTIRLHLPDKAILSIDFSPFEIVFTSKDLYQMSENANSINIEFYLVLQDNDGNNFEGIEQEIELDQISGSPDFQCPFMPKCSMTRANVLGNKLTFAWLCSKEFKLLSQDLLKEAFIRIKFSETTTEFLRNGNFEIVTGPFGTHLQITFGYPKKARPKSGPCTFA